MVYESHLTVHSIEPTIFVVNCLLQHIHQQSSYAKIAQHTIYYILVPFSLFGNKNSIQYNTYISQLSKNHAITNSM